MEFNKCERCGNFFVSNTNACPNCAEKDKIDISKLENYIQDYTIPSTLDELSRNTGISIKNLSRHLSNNPQFMEISNNLNKKQL